MIALRPRHLIGASSDACSVYFVVKIEKMIFHSKGCEQTGVNLQHALSLRPCLALMKRNAQKHFKPSNRRAGGFGLGSTPLSEPADSG